MCILERAREGLFHIEGMCTLMQQWISALLNNKSLGVTRNVLPFISLCLILVTTFHECYIMYGASAATQGKLIDT
jgi:hypothetical protein